MQTKTETVVATQAKDMVLGDAVRLFEGPFGWCLVIEVNKEAVVLHRAYLHRSDFSVSDGGSGERVTVYTGTEHVSLSVESTRTYDVDVATHGYLTSHPIL